MIVICSHRGGASCCDNGASGASGESGDSDDSGDSGEW
jgi:hypothetical protein